jgi:hypothetical protein
MNPRHKKHVRSRSRFTLTVSEPPDSPKLWSLVDSNLSRWLCYVPAEL